MITTTDKERENLSELLPWYANNTLSDADMERVEKALEEDSTLRLELDLVLEDMAATAELAEETVIPLHMEERFQAQLQQTLAWEGNTTPASVEKQKEWSLSGLFNALFPTQSFAYAAGALMLVVAVQAGVIVSLTGESQQPAQYTTATGEDPTATAGIVYLIQFSSEAGIGNIAAFLSQNQGKIVEGPLADGLFRVSFKDKKTIRLGGGFSETEAI